MSPTSPSADEPIGVNVKILDKEYRIACRPDEQQGLLDSARLLDGRMREIRQTGRVIGTDRMAVLAALNIAHELIQLQRVQSGDDSDLVRRLRRMEAKVASALGTEALDASAERV